MDKNMTKKELLALTADLQGRLSELEKEVIRLKQTEEDLIREKKFNDRLIATAQVIILVLSPEGKIMYFNPYMEKISGYKLEDVIGKEWFITFLPSDDHENIRELFSKAIRGTQTMGNVNPIVTANGDDLLIEWHDTTVVDKDGNVVSLLSIGVDISARRRAEIERDQYREELTELLTKILSGFIPICARCKMIRDDKDNWEQIESYIHKRTEAKFSHTICPRCAKVLYPDIDVPSGVSKPKDETKS